MKQQTAVEWLEKEIFRRYKFTFQQLNTHQLEEAIQQALEMESEKKQKFDEMLEMLEKCEYFIRASNQYSELGKKVEQLIKEASKI
jgi:uncharacterized membrane protein YheB (UPF0754 family)